MTAYALVLVCGMAVASLVLVFVVGFYLSWGEVKIIPEAPQIHHVFQDDVIARSFLGRGSACGDHVQKEYVTRDDGGVEVV